jgi:hypothetical protein
MNRVGVPHLTRRHSAFHVPADTSTYAGPVAVGPCDVEPKVGGITPQVVIGECLLVAKEQLVHVREPVLEGGRLGGSGHGQGVRMDPGQREMPEGEPDTLAQFCLDKLDPPKRLPRVRALVIALLDNQATCKRAADMIHCLVDRFQGRLEAIDDIHTKSMLLQRHHRGRERLVIRQRGKPVRCMGRTHWCSFFAGISLWAEPGCSHAG